MLKDRTRVPPHVADALRQINDWQKATSEPSPAVEPGSSLSGDDAKVPTLRVSTSALRTRLTICTRYRPCSLKQRSSTPTLSTACYGPLSKPLAKQSGFWNPAAARNGYAVVSSGPTRTSAGARSSWTWPVSSRRAGPTQNELRRSEISRHCTAWTLTTSAAAGAHSAN